MSRLPTVNSDNNTWGDVLNDYLSVSLDTDGTIKAAAITTALKATNQNFTGIISLSRDLTHYINYTPTSDIAVTLDSNPVIGGSAEIRMIGNGVNTPTFTTFVASTSNVAYDPTAAAVNKIVFYYDGTSAFYSITVL